MMDRKKGTVPNLHREQAAATLDIALESSLARLIPGYPDVTLCVALSGGVDSVALLHAAHRLSSRDPRIRLRAMHVDHGLQGASKAWASRCQAVCDRLGVPLQVLELGLVVAKGASVEAEARSARYSAMADALQPAECLLTAHHADDQLETVLLQLFRGAGVSGLAAMPNLAPLGSGHHIRPLLHVARDELVAYATAKGLDWVEDPMNVESRYDRAYLRHQVLPAIRARWPAVARTVGRSARHFADAKELLAALAQADGKALVDDPGRLEIAGLVALPRERQVNVLRWWIAEQGLETPSTARLASILRDLVPARDDAQPVVTWPEGEVRRYRGRLYAMQPLGQATQRAYAIEPGQRLFIEGTGSVVLEESTGEGIDAARFPGPYELRLRRGGEKLRPAGRAEERSVGRLLVEGGVEPWLRARVPLVYHGSRLLAVADRWLAAEAVVAGDGRGLQLRWIAAGCGTPARRP